MSKGCVYILTNEAMPGLVKIGMTTGDPMTRAAQLQTTGVPLPFEVYAEVFSPDCAALEKAVHQSLQQSRVDNSREFFRLSADDAETALRERHLEMVSDWLEEFLPHHTIVNELDFIDPSTVGRAAELAGVNTFDMDRVFSRLTAEDLAPAVQRHKDWVKKRKERMGKDHPLYGVDLQKPEGRVQ